jgi:hypothetical protein
MELAMYRCHNLFDTILSNNFQYKSKFVDINNIILWDQKKTVYKLLINNEIKYNPFIYDTVYLGIIKYILPVYFHITVIVVFTKNKKRCQFFTYFFYRSSQNYVVFFYHIFSGSPSQVEILWDQKKTVYKLLINNEIKVLVVIFLTMKHQKWAYG